MFEKPDKEFHELRHYLRLKSVFPVEFVGVDGILKKEISSPQMGFTSNISTGGICLNTYYLDGETVRCLREKKIILNLKIFIPLYRPPVKATASIAWIKEADDTTQSKYFIGLQFITIDQSGLRRMFKEAQWLAWASVVAMGLAGISLLLLSVGFFYHMKLHLENKALISRFIAVQEGETRTQEILSGIDGEKIKLSVTLQDYRNKISQLEAQLKSAEAQIAAGSEKEKALVGTIDSSNQAIRALKEEMGKLNTQKIPLENQYTTLLSRQEAVVGELAVLHQKKSGLQTAVVEKMYQWLLNHQNGSTGLILSFEGNVGIVKDWAFSYDQALAANVFLLFGNNDGAKKIINFFFRKRDPDFSGFRNAYYVDSGEIAEHAVHCGPNIWIGIAVLQYTKKTADRAYLPLADQIADWLITIQDQDPAGGLRGGPEMTWFATEHNLDAYAFFGMLYQMTQNEKYNTAQQKTLNWLKNYSMAAHGGDYRTPPVKRGRGDATIATDTFAWSLASLGPEKLIEIGMNPEEIMNFAKDNCEAKVRFTRPNGLAVDVTGFDFAKYTNLARGGIISPEWTSQMIVSYQVLSKYFLKSGDPPKAVYYRDQAEFYLGELNKLIISSLSIKGQGEGCLPYATAEDVDTGHGWRTPHGTTTGSIAGTAYMLMAIKEYNPLSQE